MVGEIGAGRHLLEGSKASGAGNESAAAGNAHDVGDVDRYALNM